MPRQHPPDAKKPKNWAVVIGIDKYWDRSSCLREAVADALRVREWLLRPDGGAVVLERLFLFLGVLAPPNPEVTYKEATHLNIAKIFRDLNLQRGDRFFFYFAGHGIVDQTKGQDYGQFLIPEDCNPDRPNNALLLSDIISFCKHIGFDEQFFFSDACRTPWPEKNLAFARFPYLARGKVKAINQFVIYASSENTFAFDGIFNRALLKGLSGDDDARRWDPVREQHVVTFTSLFDYVASSAPKLQVARRGGESGRADGRPNDPILAAFDPPLPRPNPNRFSIAVSNLERDPKRELEHILVDQLSRIDEIVEVFRLGRPIAAGFQHDERSRAARDKALMILDATEIDGVIWGEALALDNQRAPACISRWAPKPSGQVRRTLSENSRFLKSSGRTSSTSLP